MRETLAGLRDRATSPRTRAEYEDGLQCPPMPDAAEYLWSWFLDLHRARGSGGMGPSTISYLDIDAWCRLRRIRLAVWELDVLLALDGAWMTAQANRE